MSSDRDTLAGQVWTLTDLLSECSYKGMTPRETADELLAAGWRPPAQVIETPENGGDYAAAIAALNALPSGAVARVRRDVFQSIGSGWWEAIGRRRSFSSEQVVDLADGDSVVVLEFPTERAGTE